MQFDQSNVKPGMHVICGDCISPLGKRRVLSTQDSGVKTEPIGKRLKPFFYWHEIASIVPDEPWRKDVGKRVRVCTAVGKYLGMNKDGVHFIQCEEKTRGWTSGKAESDITPIGTPNCWCGDSYELIEDEWLPLTEENIKRLRVGDEVEIDCHPNKWHEVVKEIEGKKMHVASGGFFRIGEGYDFRLISRKEEKECPLLTGTNGGGKEGGGAGTGWVCPKVTAIMEEEAKGEEKPTTATEILNKFNHNQRQDIIYAMVNMMRNKTLLSSTPLFNYSKPLPNIIKPTGHKTLMNSLQEIADKAKLIAIGVTNPDERLAIENEIKNLDGSYTSHFLAIVREKEAEKARKAKEEADKAMYAAYEAEMIKDIKAVKAEEGKK